MFHLPLVLSGVAPRDTNTISLNETVKSVSFKTTPHPQFKFPEEKTDPKNVNSVCVKIPKELKPKILFSLFYFSPPF